MLTTHKDELNPGAWHVVRPVSACSRKKNSRDRQVLAAKTNLTLHCVETADVQIKK